MINAPASPAGINGRNRRLLTKLHREFPGPFMVREAAAVLDLARIHRSDVVLPFK